MIQGMLYIISAPSGAGKSSLIQALLKIKHLYEIGVSISYTTRKMRPGEKNGENYYFISEKKFQQMIEYKDFIEYALVFGNYYGTSRIVIEKIINNGIDLFLDIDWQGAQQVRKKISLIRTIFILPPSKDELLRRLRGRRQDSEKVIEQRMAQFFAEIKHYNEYDYIIVNDNFNTALKNLESIIRSERLHLEYQIQKHNTLINKLLVD
ncbi:MAG: guanylate kinase [Arsenophonus sp. ET-KM2-MAG3]